MIKQSLVFIKELLRSDAISGVLLIICVGMSLIVANSQWSQVFNHFLDTKFGYQSSRVHFNYTVLGWINDGLMAIFFLFVGLEIKREIIRGELAGVKNAALPVFAALGGMLTPALIFYLINHGTPTAGGWGIPMATDIAFAVAVLSLLGKRVPLSLTVFLKALAIVDDLGAIVVIAIFYSTGITVNYLWLAALVYALQLLCNWLKIKHLWVYLALGIVLWYFIHLSGIHATVAGVLTAFAIPDSKADDKHSLLVRLEHLLNIPVSYLILPLFAFVNTNITVSSDMLNGLTTPLALGIAAGLFIGKPVGITLFSWIAVKARLSALPNKTTWTKLWGAGMLAGIGFTMSIFITLLSFKETTLHNEGKLAILLVSVLSAVAGFVYLKFNKQGVSVSSK